MCHIRTLSSFDRLWQRGISKHSLAKARTLSKVSIPRQLVSNKEFHLNADARILP